MRCVLAPRPDHERVAQDYFVYDLTLFHGLTLLRNDVSVHRYPVLSQPPDLIVSHNPDHVADRKFIEAWREHSPVVVHLHCQYQYFASKELRGPFSAFSNRENIDICLQHADIIVVPSGFLADDLRRIPVKLKPNAKVEVVSNGARQSLYYPSTLRQRTNFKTNIPGLTSSQPTMAQRQIPLDKKLIGFVGRLEDLKGRQLLEILVRENATNNRLADACLLLQFRYQPGNEEYDRCRQSAETLSLINPDFVRLYADSCPRGANRPMRHLDVLLLPSLSEVQPMVVLEALSCGVPVVTTKSTPFFDELVTKFSEHEFQMTSISGRCDGGGVGISSLTESDRPEEAARRLIEAIDKIRPLDDAQRIDLSRKAGELGYSDAKMYAQYLDLYSRAVNESNRTVKATEVSGRAI